MGCECCIVLKPPRQTIMLSLNVTADGRES